MNEYIASLNEAANPELEAASCHGILTVALILFLAGVERQRDLDSNGLYPSPLLVDHLSQRNTKRMDCWGFCSLNSISTQSCRPTIIISRPQVTLPLPASTLIKGIAGYRAHLTETPYPCSCMAHTQTYRHACINPDTPCENFIPIRDFAVQFSTSFSCSGR